MGKANTQLNLNLVYDPDPDVVLLVGWVQHPITRKQVIVSQTDITRDFEMIERKRREKRDAETEGSGSAEPGTDGRG